MSSRSVPIGSLAESRRYSPWAHAEFGNRGMSSIVLLVTPKEAGQDEKGRLLAEVVSAGLWTRLVASLKGEQSAATLEAYRRAGGMVYGDLEQAEALREEFVLKRVIPWEIPPAAATRMLCVWNAYVLQTLGEHMMDADYRADPGTVGYLPRVTAAQVGLLFAQVEIWVSRARQAADNPAYRLNEDLALPADLPPWVEAEPCPDAHLRAMVAACQALRERAEVALGGFEKAVVMLGKRESADLARLRQLEAEASTAADYAAGLLVGGGGERLHEDIEDRLKRALGNYYHLGQLLAMPSLITEYGRRPQQDVYASFPASPVDAGDFDPWCLTSAEMRKALGGETRAQVTINAMWAADPDPAATLNVQGELEAALQTGAIRHGGKGGRRLSYYCCPWAPIYKAARPVTIGGVRIESRQQFTYDVSAEKMAEGGPFVRRILLGDFSPTSELDYCDGEGHHG